MSLQQKVVPQISNKNLILIFPIFFALISVLFLKPHENSCEIPVPEKKPTFYLFDRHGPNSVVLKAVENVLNRLGLERIYKNIEPENITMDYDLFWCFHHQNVHSLNWTNLKFHQKLNHIPGNYALVSKSVLGTTTDSPYVPKAFLKSENCQKYAAQHPEKLFVMKLKSNRGVKLVKPNEMNFTISSSLENYFAQEFIDKPLLWDGYKFDFSIFVVITSVNPLRLYYYDKTVNLRFCLKPYSIDDPEDVGSYVIGSEFQAAQNFKPVQEFIMNGFTNKDAFENMMRRRGVNLEEIWWKVEDLIRSVVMGKEKIMIDAVRMIL